MSKPVIALTMGDVAGIGPELVAKACASSEVHDVCIPLVVGHPQLFERTSANLKLNLSPFEFDPKCDDRELLAQPLSKSASSNSIAIWNPGQENVLDVPLGGRDARAGQAAFDYLTAAATAAFDGRIDAITTAPLNKAALHDAGLNYPGHTEILANVCGVSNFAMMLYLPQSEIVKSNSGLGVVHVTLHTSIRSVPVLLSIEAIANKIELIHGFMQRMNCESPRIGVCALNPHAGEDGIFGDEEQTLIQPAVEQAQESLPHVTGPLPADTLFKRAVAGEFDGVVAMYHDQGHIAFKLIGFDQAANVTLGLPIVRTSPSSGTAYDIAGRGIANASGMIHAIQVAAQLHASK